MNSRSSSQPERYVSAHGSGSSVCGVPSISGSLSGRLIIADAPDLTRDDAAPVLGDEAIDDHALGGAKPSVRGLIGLSQIHRDAAAAGHDLHSGSGDPLDLPVDPDALLCVE